MSAPIVRQRRDFTAALLALLAAPGCNRNRPPEKRTAKMSHETWVLWPEGTPPAGGWPVLLFLHGQGEAAWVEDGRGGTEQKPDAVLAHGSPVALHRARDGRVPTLWQSFVLIAPQAFNDTGVISWWWWGEDAVRRHFVADVERVLQSGKVNAQRLVATGFSRGGEGCYALDSDSGPFKFARIASVDAQDLEKLPAAVARRRQVRAYYSPNTHPVIAERHVAAVKAQAGVAAVTFLSRPQRGNVDEAHAALCQQVYAEDELYRWLLG